MRITEGFVDGLVALQLETSAWRATILPAVGGKLISLIAQASGEEWLWRQPGRSFRTPNYGGDFAEYDISGFDECFPGIGVGLYPAPPWQGTIVPDHGELWSQAWEYERTSDGIRMWVEGVRFPYRFERQISAAENGALVLSYRVENLSQSPLHYMWAAHPLFAVRPETRILLPDVASILVDSSKDNRLGGFLAAHSWPLTQDQHGQAVDLSKIATPQQSTADKLFAIGMRAGWCALHHAPSAEYLALTFDLAELPFLGLWINQGGWPSAAEPAFHVALEPCSGYPDRLDIAVERGQAATLAGQTTVAWSFRLHCGQAESFAIVHADGSVG